MRGDAVSGALLAALGGYAGFKAWGFGLGALSQPGAGFFPFLGALLIAGCGLAIAVRALAPAAGEAPAGPALGNWKLWACVAALVGYAVALPLIGFTLSTFLILGALSRLDPRTTWAGTFLTALLGAAGFWLVFVRALNVNFPRPLAGL